MVVPQTTDAAGGLIEPLFERFDEYLIEQGYAAKGGQIIDATLIPVPKQHNHDENQKIKQGEIPPSWQDKPHKRSQKDTDARWTKQGGKSYFGYKDHVGIDAEHGLIRRYAVTDAAVHDSQVLGQLLDEDNDSDTLWADSAYRSETIEETLKLIGFDSQIHQRADRNQPLSEEQKQSNRTNSKTRAKSEEQKQSNRTNSKTRAKVEHVFGAWVNADGWQSRALYRHRAGEGRIGLEEFNLQLDSLHLC